MTDIRYPASGNIRVWWTPANGFANYKSPTVPELTASLDISDAISWNDYSFGIQASTTNNDPAITAKGNVAGRGASQYGGSLSFYFPLADDDSSNLYSVVKDLLYIPGTRGYITVRSDGSELLTSAGNASHPGTAPGAGDIVNVYLVETAGYGHSITGEEAFRYTVSFLSKGALSVNAIVRPTSAAPTVTSTLAFGVASAAVGTKAIVKVTVQGREYTRGVRLTSSAPNVASVSRNGVITRRAAGTANILATFEATGTAATPLAITVT